MKKADFPVYVRFWMKSSRGTDKSFIRLYERPVDDVELKETVDDWVERYGPQVSENVVHYGFERMDKSKLPRNRREALAQWRRINKWYYEIDYARRDLRDLLALPPFNGVKLKKRKAA